MEILTSIVEHIETEHTWWPLADQLWRSAPKCDTDIVSNSATGAARGKRTLDSAIPPQAINPKAKSDDTGSISDEGDAEAESASEKQDVEDEGGNEADTPDVCVVFPSVVLVSLDPSIGTRSCV